MEASINDRTDRVTNDSLPELMRDCQTISLATVRRSVILSV